MAQLGTYSYNYAVEVYPTLRLSRFTLRVEVLDERLGKVKWLKVRFMQYHADKRPPNTVTWVKAHRVKLDDAPPPAREIRLPYKD